MEADTDEKHAMDPASTTLSMPSTSLHLTKSVAISPKSMTLPLSSSLSSLCKTPLLDENEYGLLKEQHILHTYDSGFSDWTPDSLASQASLSETPLLLHGASVKSTASLLSESESAEFFVKHHHQRRSWPLRSRKLSFQSPESDINTTQDSLQMICSAQEDDGCSLNNENAANSTSFHSSEEEVRLILSKSNIAKHSPVGQFLERSRSFSRSPLSSVSDDLESSFQEMSLEENSSSSNSSSNQPSPTPLTSSSPVFSFSLQHKSRDNVGASYVSENGRKLSHLSWENSRFPKDDSSDSEGSNTDIHQSASSQNTVLPKEECVISSISCQTFSQRENSHNKVDFASSLSLIPVKEPSRHVSQNISSTSFHQQDITLPKSSSSPNLLLSPLPLPHISSNCQSHCSNSHPCSACIDTHLSTSASVGNFIKSPIKRTSDIPHPTCNELISPQKMRKLRFQGKTAYSCKLKRDLFSYQDKVHENRDTDSIPLSNNDESSIVQHRVMRSADERTPQFLHIGLSPNTISEKSHLTSHVKAQATPVSRWGISNPRHCKNVKSKERSKEADAELVDRVCLKFSPSVPSQLIGRQVGVKQFDILGELQRLNFIECVEIILAYIPDSDLLKITGVSVGWKRAVFAESKACRRYKSLCKKNSSPRKVRNQAEKENVGKLSDKEKVQMTLSKGHLTAIQPQFVVTDSSTPLPTPQSSELLSEDRTRNCPHCQCRAVVVPSQDRATCMSEKCAYDFCTKCFFPFHHPCPCKPLFQCASKTMLAGSKKSKRNLKRLKNL